MAPEKRRGKTKLSMLPLTTILVVSSLCCLWLLELTPLSCSRGVKSSNRSTSTSNIVFVISSSSRTLPARADYLAAWWRPSSMRGFLWMDEVVEGLPQSQQLPPQVKSEPLPPALENMGDPSHVRMARAIGETLRLLGEDGQRSIDWVVFGDDDTVFVAENLDAVLSGYRSSSMVYVGGLSELHYQRLVHPGMAFGGGGIALSLPLARAMERVQDDCLARYGWEVYGADGRIHACASELGVPLTVHEGFHQMDLSGDAFGLLAAHPVAAAVSIHHLDAIEPLFPGLTRLDSVRHLLLAAAADPAAILQLSTCHIVSEALNATIGISWGYAVQVLPGLPLQPVREMELPWKTFGGWAGHEDFVFPTRPFPQPPCPGPLRFFLVNVSRSWSTYQLSGDGCGYPLRSIRVFKRRTAPSWYKQPRRQCCNLLSIHSDIQVELRNCKTLRDAK